MAFEAAQVDEAVLAIGAARIGQRTRPTGEHLSRVSEIQSAFRKVLSRLTVSKLTFTRINVSHLITRANMGEPAPGVGESVV